MLIEVGSGPGVNDPAAVVETVKRPLPTTGSCHRAGSHTCVFSAPCCWRNTRTRGDRREPTASVSPLPTSFGPFFGRSVQLRACNHHMYVVPTSPDDLPSGTPVMFSPGPATTLGNAQPKLTWYQSRRIKVCQSADNHNPHPRYRCLQRTRLAGPVGLRTPARCFRIV